MSIPLPIVPPPVIFTYDETLHAISLPPLASFLTSLTAPDHLIKLSDSLDRYRTPKSYHRIDERAIESSELPPHSPAQRKKASGEPAVLESWSEAVYPITPSIRLHPDATSPANRHLPLPMTRRIRELRLDLRTLDEGALFALETWRRQALGLAKLKLKLPDSDWHNNHSPTPPALTSLAPKTKRRRPRKADLPKMETVKGGGEFHSLMEALNANGTAESADIGEGLDVEHFSSAEIMIMQALEELARHESGQVRQHPRSSVEDAASMAGVDVSPRPSRSDSADIILGDAFDEEEAEDPDFVPRLIKRSFKRGGRRDKTKTRRSKTPNASTVSVQIEGVSYPGPSSQDDFRKESQRIKSSDSHAKPSAKSLPIARKRDRPSSRLAKNPSGDSTKTSLLSRQKRQRLFMEDVVIPISRKRFRQLRMSGMSDKSVHFVKDGEGDAT
ncbi:MAG: hypothetical protein TREMPRED_000557 [Tremellales sp. Tagirdzhanova-0007]|nr:MAG: hypothetical protein TREMPRED_000557 [Tremellales sp. Tagirdzhanova-0007]